jgi:hypothetical protein
VAESLDALWKRTPAFRQAEFENAKRGVEDMVVGRVETFCTLAPDMLVRLRSCRRCKIKEGGKY